MPVERAREKRFYPSVASWKTAPPKPAATSPSEGNSALRAHQGASGMDGAKDKPASGADPAVLLELARAKTNASGDPRVMDAVDPFRASLGKEEQKLYDQTLERLRHDDRISFDFRDGATPDLATRELALRGIAAASFGRPAELEAGLRTATNSTFVPDEHGGHVERTPGQGHFTIAVYPSEFPTAENTPSQDGGIELNGGLKTEQGTLVISQDFLFEQAPRNDNLLVHEFSHVLQGLSQDPRGQSQGRDFPPTFGEERTAAFEDAFQSDEVQELLESKGLNHELGGESFPTIQNLFRQQPEALRDASPELYQTMVDWAGFDPATGRLTEQGQRRYEPSHAPSRAR